MAPLVVRTFHPLHLRRYCYSSYPLPRSLVSDILPCSPQSSLANHSQGCQWSFPGRARLQSLFWRLWIIHLLAHQRYRSHGSVLRRAIPNWRPQPASQHLFPTLPRWSSVHLPILVLEDLQLVHAASRPPAVHQIEGHRYLYGHARHSNHDQWRRCHAGSEAR